MDREKLRILLTNHSLDVHAGTELYVRDVATALQQRGHDPFCYSSLTGPVGAEIRAAGVTVLSRLAGGVAAPQVIHGQHHLQVLAALLAFPDVPAVSVCHGVTPWQEAPLCHPRILRYVAVSELTREWVSASTGLPLERIRLIGNFVDLRRFRPRSDLPSRARRVLVFDNYLNESNGLKLVRAACEREGLSLDAAGVAAGRPISRPEDRLGNYDIVFASGRCALESLAVGAAVIVCGVDGCGPMVDPANLARYRSHNFGLRSYERPLDVDYLARQIRRYDPVAAGEVSRRIRDGASLDRAVDCLLGLYREVIAEWHQADRPDPEEERAATLRYLESWARRFTLNVEGREPEQLRKELKAVYQSASWRWTQGFLRTPLLCTLINPLVRKLAFRAGQRAAATPQGPDLTRG